MHELQERTLRMQQATDNSPKDGNQYAARTLPAVKNRQRKHPEITHVSRCDKIKFQHIKYQLITKWFVNC